MRIPKPPVATSWLLAIALAAPGLAFAQRAPLLEPETDRSRGEEEQIRKREEWFVLSRGLDKVERPDRLRAQAVAEMAEGSRARADLLRLRAETWQPLGPETMTMLSWTMGPVAGRVVSLAVHPSDEDVLYLGAASGGLWKTTDGGTSWTSVFDEVGTLSIGALALDPEDPNVLWVGTGERQTNCANYFGLGLFRSPDGGQTFEARNGTAPNALELSYIVSIAPHPTDPLTLFASGDAFCRDGVREPGGVFKSTDGGATWRRVLTGTGSDVIYDPGNPDVVYAMMSGVGVHKSLDGGETWAPASTGITASTRMRLAMAPSDPQTLYVLTSGDRLYRSDDDAATWVLKNSDACDGQCTYNLCLDVHPTDPETILVGTIKHFKSTDGGVNLFAQTTGWGSSQSVHQDTHIVRFSRTNGLRFWVGGDGGLWRTDDGGGLGGFYWNLNANLILTQFYDVAMDPTDPLIVYGGAQDNSSSRRFGGLQQWNVTVVTGDGFVNVVDPATPSLVFQTSYPSGNLPSVYRSTSGGAPGTFVRLATNGIVSGPFPWVTPLAIRPEAIFVASNSVYSGRTSQTGSFTWTRISGVLSNGSVSVLTRATETSWPFAGDIWAGTSDGRIHRGRNEMEYGPRVQWTNVSGNYPAGSYVSDIAIDANQPDRVFVTRGAFGLSRLYRSLTGGTTWAEVGGGLPNVPANAVAIDPLDGNRIFVGTDVGIYESTNGGDTFLPFSEGMPLGVVVTDLEIAAAPHVLVAGTYGRGAFLVNLLSTPAVPSSEAARRAR